MKNFAEYAPKSLAAGAPPRTPLGELKRSPKPPSRNARGFAPRAWALRALESPTLSNGKCPPSSKMKFRIRPWMLLMFCPGLVIQSDNYIIIIIL